MTHAMDGYPGIEHTLPIIPAYEDVIELFKASETTNSPTLLVSYGAPWVENYFYTTEDVVGDEQRVGRDVGDVEAAPVARQRGRLAQAVLRAEAAL